MNFHKIADASDLSKPYKIVATDKILFAEMHPQSDHTVIVHIAFAGPDDLVIQNLSRDEAHQLLNELGSITPPATI